MFQLPTHSLGGDPGAGPGDGDPLVGVDVDDADSGGLVKLDASVADQTLSRFFM